VDSSPPEAGARSNEMLPRLDRQNNPVAIPTMGINVAKADHRLNTSDGLVK
jgi:hypothetical protein